MDDWHVLHWLTLNLGVRYGIFTPFTEPHGHISNFDPATELIVSPGLTGPNHSAATAGVATDYQGFEPHFGFAATVHPGTVVRGGFDMTYFPMNYASAATLGNAPFSYTGFCGVAGNAVGGALCAGNSQGYAVLSNPVPMPVLQTSLATNTANYPNEGVLEGTAANYKTSYLEQYSLQIQQDLKGNVITVGYIGNLGRHMFTNKENFNQQPTSTTPGPYANLYGNAIIDVISTEAIQRYNALQLVLERRLAHGLAANASYTWAHNISSAAAQEDASSVFGDCVQGPCIEDSPSGPKTVKNGNAYDLGDSDLDNRQEISVAIDYDIPMSGNIKGLAGGIFKNWTANLSGSWLSGNPFTILEGSNIAGIPGINGRPDSVGNPKLSNPSPTHGWYNINALHAQAPGTLGDAGRNQVYGPPQRAFNFSIFKTFPIVENIKLQFRAEAFNISNTPNFTAPGSTISFDSTGKPLASTDNYSSGTNAFITPREYQFPLKLLF
ncbi:MAG: hypothetical protein ACLPLZ_03120 [Terracidiphilus sp.]